MMCGCECDVGVCCVICGVCESEVEDACALKCRTTLIVY